MGKNLAPKPHDKICPRCHQDHSYGGFTCYERPRRKRKAKEPFKMPNDVRPNDLDIELEDQDPEDREFYPDPGSRPRWVY